MTDTQAQEAARLAEALNKAAPWADGHVNHEAAALLRSQAARIAELERERDEADRRAGAAERNAEYLRDGAVKRASWLHEAKQQWGADPNVSFDVVWAEALSARAELARMREPLSAEALAGKCEAWLQLGGATNVVDAFEAGYRECEAHGITKTGGGV